MATVAQITHSRLRRRSRTGRSPGRKFALGCAGLISLGLALASIFLASFYADLIRELPSIESLPVLLDPPDGILLQPTRLYDRSGEHLLLSLENPDAPGRQYLPLTAKSLTYPEEAAPESLPSTLVIATIASIDPSFWEHPGFSYLGIRTGNHTTLAQRLASDLLLQEEPPGIRRSLRERLLAGQITTRFGRQKVLEWFLNYAYFGRLTYGAEAASRLYFGKSAWELDLAEAAMLAAVAQDPAINPIDTPQSALESQKQVIQKLLQYRLVTPEDGVQAAQEELKLQAPERPGKVLTTADLEPSLAPAFASLVLHQLESVTPREVIERGGLTIHTTLDYDLQVQATCAIKVQLERIQTTQTDDKSQDCEASRLLPAMPVDPSPSPLNLKTEAVILDPANGQILAMVGEPPVGLDSQALNNHPSGSQITPFIYLTAFTRGFSPATLVWDIPSEEPDLGTLDIDGIFHGPVRLRIAMANDYQAAAASVLNQVGLENVWRTADQLGLQFPRPLPAESGDTTASLFRNVNLLEISQIFGIFANQGILAGRAIGVGNGSNGEPVARQLSFPLDPLSILHVENPVQQVYLDWNDHQERPIISPQLAYLMTNVLSDEGARWPSLGHPNELEIGRPAAAKFSRTASSESNWALGYTQQLALGVWLGQEEKQAVTQAVDPRLIQHATTGLWHAIMQYASRGLPYQEWIVPAGISEIPVCDPSGQLPTKDCPNVVDEVFLAGSEPVQADPLYHTLRVDTQSGRLATVYTPLDQVEDRPYFVVPSEASQWARQAGLELPPKDYDAIPGAASAWDNVEITSPTMFQAVSGRVPIIGSASADGFDFYRIQVGEGLNPQGWYQVGQDQSPPVQNGKLGEWDTSDLDGLYAIQLLVVSQDQSAYRHTVLVTVDNSPPEVQITYPNQGEAINFEPGGLIVIQADIRDNIGIESVDYFINDDLLGALTQPPFAVSWKLKAGAVSLVVKATDKAGNTSEDTITFTVQ